MSAVTSLSRNDPTVDPGGQAAVTMKIRNSGSIVDRFDVDIVGPTTGWARVDPPSLSLFPGVEGTVTITFSPPRASMPRAGIYPFGVRVRPEADPAGSTVEEGRISVTPFTLVAADIVPVTSRGSRVGRHQVIVANRGNASSEVAVTAEDPDRRLKLGVVPVRGVVAPDAKVAFDVRVEVDDPFPFGQDRQRPFGVKVEPGRQAPIELRGTLSQLPMLPGWIPPVAGVIGIVALLSVGAFLAKAGPFTPEATPVPSVAEVSAPPSAAAPSQAASEPPSEAASAPASEAAPASPTPTPPPSAPQQQIRFIGFELEDVGFRPEVPKAQSEPLITFTTDGPGDVVLNLTKNEGNNNVPVHLCLVADGGKQFCDDLSGTGAVTATNNQTGTRSWSAFARPKAPDSAPFIDLQLDFFANSSSVIWSDNSEFFADGTDTQPQTRGVNTIIRGPATASLLSVQTTFTEDAASFNWAQWPVGQPQPPMQRVDNVLTFDPGPLQLPAGGFLEYSFIGLGTFNGGAVTYSLKFAW